MRTLFTLFVIFLTLAWNRATPVDRTTSDAERAENAGSPDLPFNLSLANPPLSNEKGKRPRESHELNLFPTQAVKKAKTTSYSSIKHKLDVGSSKDWLSMKHGVAASSTAERGMPDSGTSRPTSEKRGRLLRKSAFWTQYEGQNLGHHMTAKDLADKVRAIKVDGKSPTWTTAWVKKRLRDSGASDKYIADFRQETKATSYKMMSVKRYNREYQGMDKNEQERVLQEHVKKTQERKASASHTRRWNAKQLQSKAKQDALNAEAGELFEAHFKDKKMDVGKMHVKDVEEHSRDMPIKGSKNIFAKALNLYLADKRREIDLNQFRAYREDHHRAQSVAKQALKRQG